jgi:hypothetical protein
VTLSTSHSAALPRGESPKSIATGSRQVEIFRCADCGVLPRKRSVFFCRDCVDGFVRKGTARSNPGA